MSEGWSKWERQIVNGVYPLRLFLGNSDHSVVFLTECTALGLTDAAIKLVPASASLDETRLTRWRTAATLLHPHLVRTLDAGRCQLGGHPFLFVVTEYAEQTLAQILQRRTLTVDEVREIVSPAVDALGYLHGRHLVHGQLKPSNIVSINDQLKLATDSVRPAGEVTAGIAKPSPYDAPEARGGKICAASDVWGLGVTLVEALTQRAPTSGEEPLLATSLPAALRPQSTDTLRRCLSREPDARPGLGELADAINPAPRASPLPVTITRVGDGRSDAGAAPVQRPLVARSFIIPAIVVGMLILAGTWAAFHWARGRPNSPQLPPHPEATAAGAAPMAAASQIAGSAPPTTTSVLHSEVPDISGSARTSIHGRIRVTVRVTVDRSGNVVDVAVKNPGPSKYFARIAADAARRWKFAPADSPPARARLLQFNFTRAGVTGKVLD